MYALTLAALTVLSAQDSLSPGARRVLADLQYLAADEREGRGVGTKGLEQAGSYIADAFRRAGLQAGGPAGSYSQDFTLAPDAPAVAHAGLGGASVRNVIGIVPGRSTALRGQVIVIGAHYDHLGLGGPNALDPDSTGRVHNGADDNASGTAALLEIARLLRGARPARTIVLVAFSAEELGVIGSTWYVQHPAPQPVDSIYAMLNLDMVGRLREQRLLAIGAATAREFPALLDSVNAAGGPGVEARFALTASGDGWGASDHAPFYAARRPVLHFFTDLHEDYHRATDDWPKINADGVARIAGYVTAVALALADRSGPLTFVDAPRPQQASGSAGTSASLGTIPDMTGSPGGVRLTGVRSGSPAERAGIRAGDIIIALGGMRVADLYGMTDALRARQPGDTVVVVVKRGAEELRLTAVLGRRGG